MSIFASKNRIRNNKKYLEIKYMGKIIYIAVWGIISFFSSFTCILKGDFTFITAEDISQAIFAPILIWAIAFFTDYIFVISQMDNNTHRLNKCWSITSYVVIDVILSALLINVFVSETWWRWLSITIIYLGMMLLKASSLYVVCPMQRVGKP